MFGVSGYEFLLAAVIGLLVLGPRDMALLAKTLARWAAEAREFLYGLRRAVDEAVMLEEIKEMRTALDPASILAPKPADAASDTTPPDTQPDSPPDDNKPA